MTDRRIFQTVVLILGGALLLSIIGITLLAVLEKDLPGVLENLSVAALASLGAMLARTPRDENDPPQPVTLVDEPISVTSAPPAKATRRDRGEGEVRSIVILAGGICAGMALYFLVVLPLLGK